MEVTSDEVTSDVTSDEVTSDVPQRGSLVPTTEWRPQAIVAWFSCEGNLNHLVGETLHPVWQQLQRFTPAASPPQLVIMGSAWPLGPDSSACHSERFAFIASLLPLTPMVLFVPEGGAPHTAYDLRSMHAVAPPRRACFGEVVQAVPSYSSGAGAQDFYQHVAAAANCTHPRTLEVLVVQRSATRRITNLPALLATILALPGVHAARTVDFATIRAQEQLQLVCAHRVLVGVHGQGMEWGHLLNAGQVDGAALIEFSAGRWPCYYAQRMKASNILSECQVHDAVGNYAQPKQMDVHVRLDVFERGARDMLRRLAPKP